jgi:CHASE1-domain containing sensor protein
MNALQMPRRAARAMARAFIPLPSLVLLVLGLLATATLFTAIRTFEQDRLEAEFQRRAGNRIAAVKQGLDDAVDALATVNRLFMAMQPVSRAQFASFATPMLESRRQLHLMAFQRLVADRDRPAFEAERAVEHPGFAITALATGKLTRAPRHAQYRVVDYLVPAAGNESAFGLDAASRSEQEAAVRRSCETGKASMTSQYGVMLGNRLQPGFMLLMPVYRAGATLAPSGSNCALVAGYTAVAISTTALLEKTLASRHLLGQVEFNISVYAQRTADPRTLVFYNGEARGAAPL